MLIAALVGLAVLSVPLTGGRLANLAGLRWRSPWLLLVVLVVQLAVLEMPDVPAAAAAALHVASYLLVGVFLVHNRAVAGLWLLALGAGCNGVTIMANGGTLPASPAAMRAAGITADDAFVNSGELDDARLTWLGDVFAVPAGWPLANVFSVGDVLIVAGACWVAHAAARRSAPVLPRPGDILAAWSTPAGP